MEERPQNNTVDPYSQLGLGTKDTHWRIKPSVPVFVYLNTLLFNFLAIPGTSVIDGLFLHLGLGALHTLFKASQTRGSIGKKKLLLMPTCTSFQSWHEAL